MIEILARISTRRFTAGLVLWDGRVVEAAPIVRFMKRWDRDRVRRYCADHDWKIEVIWEMKRPDTAGCRRRAARIAATPLTENAATLPRQPSGKEPA
jgi:hypothetical protein